MKRIILCALALVVAAASMLQATPAPQRVSWTPAVDSISPSEGIFKLTAVVEDGWHIYSQNVPLLDGMPVATPTQITIAGVNGLEFVGEFEATPAPVNHYDEALQLNLEWWAGTVTFSRRFKLNGITGLTLSGQVEYMACTDQNCTPPTVSDFSVAFGNSAQAAVNVAQDDADAEVASASVSLGNEAWWAPCDDNFESTSTAQGKSWLAIFIMGLLGGFLALLTPCVWPMIPMTVSFFLKKGKSRGRAIADALTYGLSIIVIFLILGIAITMIFGASKLNEIATSAVFNVLFFLLLVVFAISFFGAFDIKLPSRWSNAIDGAAERTTGMLSIFFMAFTLVLVSFSCTGPIIGTLLVEAASQASIGGPAMGMFGFALGLALPFGLFAFFPSLLKEMPRSGGWLNSVKVVLGFIELILSLKFLSVADLAYGWRILDREIFIAIWIVLFVLLGLYLLGKISFSHDSPIEKVSVTRFFLSVVSLSFAVYLLPGLWGAPLKGISAFAPPLYTQDFNLYGGNFQEFDDYDAGMAYATEHHKPVLIDFSGYACVNCRKMEGAVFDTPEVRQIIEKDYVLIKLMVDDKAPLAQPVTVEEYGSTTTLRTVGDRWSYLQRHKFGTNQQPFYVILNNQGRMLQAPREYDENRAAFEAWLIDGVEAYNSDK